MNRMFRISLFVLCSFFLLSGCTMFKSSHDIYRTMFGDTILHPSKEDLNSRTSRKTIHLTLAVNDIYCKDTACKCVHDVAARQYRELQKVLRKRFNIDLKLVYFMDIYEMEKPLNAQKFDGAICKPWIVYRLAVKNPKLLNYRRIADVLDPHNNEWLTGSFIVKKDSPIKSMKEVNGKTLAMGENDGYEKYYAAKVLLRKRGIKPGKIINQASCLENIGLLLDGKVDCAVISDYALCSSCAVDIARPSDVRKIASTAKIPLTSVILDMSKVSDADALRFQRALLKLSGKNAPESMLSKGFVKPAPWTPEPVE